jgi:hypothetical protein
LNPKRELKARFGEALREYVVDSDPVSGVSVRVRVYGKLDIGLPPLWLDEGPDDDDAVDGIDVAAGRVVNFNPVDSPTRDDTGE